MAVTIYSIFNLLDTLFIIIKPAGHPAILLKQDVQPFFLYSKKLLHLLLVFDFKAHSIS